MRHFHSLVESLLDGLGTLLVRHATVCGHRRSVDPLGRGLASQAILRARRAK